ncbi:MAG: HAMP domain-containing protein [Deltaproteobacteria bacterium]|nr:MAG: HAMP domain-containing protein [Deltaproteobacteria bacterium]
MFLRSLGIKLIIFIAGILVVAVGLFSYKMIDTHREQSIENATQWASDLSDAVKRSTRYDMLKGEEGREALHYAIDAIGAQQGIKKVRIFSSEGKIMFSTDKDELGKLLDKEREQCYVCHAPKRPLERLDLPSRSRIIPKAEERNYRILGIINPIYNEEDCFLCHSEEQKVLGVLDFELSLAEVDAKTRRNYYAILFFTFITIFVVSVAVGFFIYGAVSRPIKKMVIGTKKIATGDLDYTIPLKTKDEIGALASSFNRMTRDLKRANSELQEWSRTLEKKVEERTEQLKAMQAQLIQSEKLASIGKLAAGVAHEINNPLTGILTFSHLLLDETEGGEQERKDIEVIIRETTRCRDIVKRLLDYSRQAETRKTPFSINETVEKASSLLEHQAAFRNIRIIKEFDPGLPQIMIDKDKMQQVFINLLTNAQEVMPEGGSVTIATTKTNDGNSIEIRVTDTGCGIKDADIPKIFDPFFSTKELGTGLGLSVTHGIIASHKGSIEVQSKVGEGTTFIIRLPVK